MRRKLDRIVARGLPVVIGEDDLSALLTGVDQRTASRLRADAAAEGLSEAFAYQASGS